MPSASWGTPRPRARWRSCATGTASISWCPSAAPWTARTRGDIDLALAFDRHADKDFLATVTDLLALVPGDHLDVMDLDRADPVGRYTAMTGGRPLFAWPPADFWERQIFAINHYVETQPLRDAVLRSLAS